jgi:hypothetical protein
VKPKLIIAGLLATLLVLAATPSPAAGKQIAAKGGNWVFATSVEGYTQFDITNLGPNRVAVVYITWISPEGSPQEVRIVVKQIGGTQVYRNLFRGNEANLTNQSSGAKVEVSSFVD